MISNHGEKIGILRYRFLKIVASTHLGSHLMQISGFFAVSCIDSIRNNSFCWLNLFVNHSKEWSKSVVNHSKSLTPLFNWQPFVVNVLSTMLSKWNHKTFLKGLSGESYGRSVTSFNIFIKGDFLIYKKL